MRTFDAVSTYLPLLLMGLLALGTWWLVKNTPVPEFAREDEAPLHEPDYEMSDFVVQHFASDGAMRIQIEGRRMHHYPDTNTLEIDDARIRATGRDGRTLSATAKRALANADGSEVQLLGEAHVIREATAGEAQTEFRSEFLHFFQATERVRSHLPVTVTRGTSEFRADAVDYDNLARVIELKGRVRAVLAAPPGDASRGRLP
ncbi:MAG: LPS export ABC transporter periplasmic protein LptC [Burkholderiaceae bacterium]